MVPFTFFFGYGFPYKIANPRKGALTIIGFLGYQGNNGMNMQMGQVPMMAAANGAVMGMGGQQVMLVMGMPNQQGNQMMDQNHQQGWACGGQDQNAGQQGQNAVGAHPMMMPQQQFQPQQQQQFQQPASPRAKLCALSPQSFDNSAG